MKKILFLFLFTSILISCTSNDNDDVTGLDPIVGTWKLTSILMNDKEIFEDECGNRNTFTHFKDGSLIYNYYEKNGAGNCEYFESTSSWENKGNYNYIVDGIEFTYEFYNNNNSFKHTLVFEYSDDKHSDSKGFVAVIIYSRI